MITVSNPEKIKLFFFPFVLLLHLFNSCYSLNGSSLDPAIKTVEIDVFPNYAPLQNVTLSQDFTNDLRDRFQQRTPLNVVSSNADIVISGEIVGYDESYDSVTSDEQAQENKLTIKIKVKYVSNIDSKKNFTRTFQAYGKYSGNKTLTEVEGTLVPEITTQIIDQIYNAIVTDW